MVEYIYPEVIVNSYALIGTLDDGVIAPFNDVFLYLNAMGDLLARTSY